VLSERWEQIRAELGFSASSEAQPQRELAAVNHRDAWAG
jgi:hypothetical protein